MHQGLLHDIQFNPPYPFKWTQAITSNNIFSNRVQSSLKKTIRTYFNPSFAHVKSLSSYSWFQVTHLLSPTSRAPKEHHWFQNGSPAQSRSVRAWRLGTLMKQLPMCLVYVFISFLFNQSLYRSKMVSKTKDIQYSKDHQTQTPTLAASWDPWQSQNFPHHNPRPKAQTHRVLQYVGQGNAPQGCGLQIANGWCEPVAEMGIRDWTKSLMIPKNYLAKAFQHTMESYGIAWNSMLFHHTQVGLFGSTSDWTVTSYQLFSSRPAKSFPSALL